MSEMSASTSPVSSPHRATEKPLHFWLALGLVTFLSFVTYVVNFHQPDAFFWDENYHIASAQKYLNGIYFMEQHPPLGKLLIAAGEVVWTTLTPDSPEVCLQEETRQSSLCNTPWRSNSAAYNRLYVGTDYASNSPPGFVFAGYRLFPVLLAWLTAPLLFLTLFFLTRDLLTSVIGSFLYTFDNALIVHSRGAMLEGALLFFSVLALLAYVVQLQTTQQPRRFLWAAGVLGAAFAAALTTKLVGLILVLLFPALAWMLRRHAGLVCRGFAVSLAAFLVTFAGVWWVHFALGRTPVATNNDMGFYQASDEARTAIAQGTTASLTSFPFLLRDAFAYVPFYSRGVPRLDLCKPDENGSPFFFWPFGAKSINYRWETPNGQQYHYLYLQANPVVWGLGLLGLALSTLLLAGTWLNAAQGQPPLRHRHALTVFLGLYVSYMLAISQIDRVMYLYHYFFPLVLSFLLVTLSFDALRTLGRHTLQLGTRTSVLLTIGCCILAGWVFYHPFSYYEPMTTEQFELRNVFPLWDLTCVNCERQNLYFTPRS
jgi:dolichyl-phosphate-mannose--protein O-mannosyl transferase